MKAVSVKKLLLFGATPFITLFLYVWGSTYYFQSPESITNFARYRSTFDDIKEHKKTYVKLSDMEKIYPIIYLEDREFYYHSGVYFKKFFENTARFINGDHVKKGGSSITQQLAKNLFLYPSKSGLRKFLEFWCALYLEFILSKNEILSLYVNNIEFGPGIYGIEEGAKYHFSKHFEDLNAIERAKLYSIIINPIKYKLSDIFEVKKLKNRYFRALKFGPILRSQLIVNNEKTK